MRSAERTPAVAARPASGPGERELKFTLSAARAHLARRWLERICRRDAEFPAAVVWTIYYDTPSLASLGEKLNSDYLKRKIRVRWYSDLDGAVSGPAFVEAKLRVGTTRTKVRRRVGAPAAEVARWDLHDPRLLALPLLLRADGIPVEPALQPTLVVRYRRDRFVEPLSESRVSLDAEIAAAAVNPCVISVNDRSPLDVAVLEVKGAGDRLPLALQPFVGLGIRKRAFSKFLALYAHTTRRVF